MSSIIISTLDFEEEEVDFDLFAEEDLSTCSCWCAGRFFKAVSEGPLGKLDVVDTAEKLANSAFAKND
jgi:hypothetical protein